MRGVSLILSMLILIGVGECLPFLWPSSFGSSTTTTTTTTHAGPPHPHAHGHSAGITTVIGQPHSSHLHVRPASVGSYFANRPLPPLVMGAHHHHHHLRPMVGPNTHLHVHGGAIAGTGHRHHYHVNQQHHHHHHPHVSRSLRYNAHSAVQA